MITKNWQLVLWPRPNEWSIGHGFWPIRMKFPKAIFENWYFGPVEIRHYRDLHR